MITIFGNNNSYVDENKSYAILTYPNPVEDQLYIKQNDVVSAELFDVSGKLIDTYHHPKTINCEKLQSGFYILQLKTKNGISQVKFIKK